MRDSVARSREPLKRHAPKRRPLDHDVRRSAAGQRRGPVGGGADCPWRQVCRGVVAISRRCARLRVHQRVPQAIAKFLTFPLIILTLGLFSLVVNGLMLWLTSVLSGALDLGFHVRGFWAAFFGALVVSLVGTLLSMMIAD